jgi:chromosome segregation ATPase
MAGILGKLAGLDSVREDMKKRVDEVLKAGSDWKATAEKLTKALEELTETIQRGNPGELNPIRTDLKKLSRETRKLAAAFNNHRQTLANLMEKI